MRALVFAEAGRRFVLTCVCAALRARNCEIIHASGSDELLEMVRGAHPDLVIVHAGADTSGTLASARRVREMDRGARIMLIASACSSDLAIAAMRSGINDVLSERCSENEVEEALERAAQREAPDKMTTSLAGSARMVGASASVNRIRQTIHRVAATDSNVLITGETGTGKELVAELIHANGRRRGRPFVSINCAAIPEGLLESELFGFERGAFTGAHAAREGTLQYARGGTLFLDEVGDMSLLAQAKILRAIESRRVRRLGGNRDVPVDIRIIAATHQNVEQLTSQQKFRQDLYFRLNVARIHLPPLREHPEDVPELVQHLLEELSEKMDRATSSVDESYLVALRRYDWPGNVRELRNVIESTLVFCTSNRVTANDLPPYLRSLFASEARKRESERETIMAALRSTGWNRTEAARLLACSRMTLYRKMVRHSLFDQEGEEVDSGCNFGAPA
jgi:DNA-binding NtrC family response regulator